MLPAAIPSRFTVGAARIRLMKNADTRMSPPVTANTAPVLNTPSRTPASAGPAKKPTLSIELVATLVAVNSFGDRAIEATRAAWAGRNGVAAIPTTAAIM